MASAEGTASRPRRTQPPVGRGRSTPKSAAKLAPPRVSAPPTDMLFDRLLRLRMAVMTLASEAFRPLDLGFKQAMLLRFLAVQATVSPSEFARATDTDPAAMVRLVGSLEKRG